MILFSVSNRVACEIIDLSLDQELIKRLSAVNFGVPIEMSSKQFNREMAKQGSGLLPRVEYPVNMPPPPPHPTPSRNCV